MNTAIGLVLVFFLALAMYFFVSIGLPWWLPAVILGGFIALVALLSFLFKVLTGG
jgi:hypothetical protein